MGKFKIANKSGEQETVEGNRITINNIKCFIFKNAKGYNISHVATGMIMSNDSFNKRESISKVKSNMKKLPGWLEKGIETLKEHGFDYPLNK